MMLHSILAVFLIRLNFVASNDVRTIFKEWNNNFQTLGTFHNFCKNLNYKRSEIGKSAKPIFKISDFDDFEFTGALDENGLPNGLGILTNLDVEMGSADYCYRGTCQKNVIQAYGNFSSGELDGAAEVYFSDGSYVRGQFIRNVLHGLAVEFDTTGQHRYTGRYIDGKKNGQFCYIEGMPSSTLCGEILDDQSSFSGQGVLFLMDYEDNELIWSANFVKGAMANGRKSKIVGWSYMEDGVLHFETESALEDDSEDWTFEPGSNHLDGGLKEVFLAQANWLLLKVHFKPVETSFLKPDVPLDQLVDKRKPIRYPDTNLDEKQPSICNLIQESIPYQEGTFHETALISALGSGSKWIGALVDWSTGVQNYIAAIELYSPIYSVGSGLLVKTHHGVLLETNEKRKRDQIEWRMNHIRRFQGRGILILRNPYTAVISHWNHRNAGNEINALQELEISLSSKRFRDFAKLEIIIWLDVAMDWLTISPDLLVIHYEDFKTDSIEQLRLIHQFLRFPIDDKRLECIRTNPYNFWKRQKKEKLSIDPFEENDLHKIFDAAIVKVQEKLKKKGLRQIPLEKYTYTKLNSI